MANDKTDHDKTNNDGSASSNRCRAKRVVSPRLPNSPAARCSTIRRCTNASIVAPSMTRRDSGERRPAPSCCGVVPSRRCWAGISPGRAGSKTAKSIFRPTASTAISPRAATRRPSSGRASRATVERSPTGELHAEVCKFANVLKGLGVQAGDRVAIYMPMIPEAAVAMLACTRIGATHTVIFGGFSAEALRDRINDCGAQACSSPPTAAGAGARWSR